MSKPIVLFKAEEATNQQPSTFFLSCQTPLFRSAKEFVGINRLRLQSLDTPVRDTTPARMLTVNCGGGNQLTYSALQQTCALNSQITRAANAQELLSYLSPTAFGGWHSDRPIAYFPVLGEQLFVRRGNAISDKILVMRCDPESPGRILFRLVQQKEFDSLRKIAVPLVMKDPDPLWSVSMQISVTGTKVPSAELATVS